MSTIFTTIQQITRIIIIKRKIMIICAIVTELVIQKIILVVYKYSLVLLS